VVTFPFKVVAPGASVVREVRATELPTRPKAVEPELLATSAWAPLMAPVKVMLPEPALTVRPPLRVVVPVIETALLVVARMPAVERTTLSP
jgi:hypothetical protein